MKRLRIAFGYMVPTFAFIFCLGYAAYAQEDEPAEVRQYRDDYEKYQKIAAITDPLKRADQIIQLIKDRPNMNTKLQENAQANLFGVLEGCIKTENNEPLLSLSERYIKVRPKVGQTYYCYGFALKNVKRYDEAMDALAKCYLMKNPLSSKAKDFLDLVYKQQHRGILVGLDQVIGKAKQDVSKMMQ
jgi:hypothetical protein